MSETVICKRIALSEDVLVKLFPTGNYAYVSSKDAYAFGAIGARDKALKGAVIYSACEEIKGAVTLESLFIYNKHHILLN